MKPDIKFLPIFDQAAPGVWRDFAQIYARITYVDYSYEKYAARMNCMIGIDIENWNKRRCKFAFGAYDDDKMIGFIEGHATRERAYVEGLYVLREYHRAGIGRGLLQRAEGTLRYYSRRIELISSAEAMGFYEGQGYSIYSGVNHYYKALPGPVRSEFIPIFHVHSALAKHCYEINPDFDPLSINNSHLSMFAYFNEHAHLDGYIGAGSSVPQLRDGKNSAYVKQVLQSRFDSFTRFHNR